jgi:hypothetical protein
LAFGFRGRSCDKLSPRNHHDGTRGVAETNVWLFGLSFTTFNKGEPSMSNQNPTPGQQNQNPNQKPGQQQGGDQKPGQQQQDPSQKPGQHMPKDR